MLLKTLKPHEQIEMVKSSEKQIITLKSNKERNQILDSDAMSNNSADFSTDLSMLPDVSNLSASNLCLSNESTSDCSIMSIESTSCSER